LANLVACVGNTSFYLVEDAILKNKRFDFGELGRKARFEEIIQVVGGTNFKSNKFEKLGEEPVVILNDGLFIFISPGKSIQLFIDDKLIKFNCVQVVKYEKHVSQLASQFRVVRNNIRQNSQEARHSF
jgi:hypothetical protein